MGRDLQSCLYRTLSALPALRSWQDQAEASLVVVAHLMQARSTPSLTPDSGSIVDRTSRMITVCLGIRRRIGVMKSSANPRRTGFEMPAREWTVDCERVPF